MTTNREHDYKQGLAAALSAGEELLAQGASALDVVEAVVAVLETDPLFNAGHGATLTADGHAELDAAIMDGATLRAGAAAQLCRVKHPVHLARRILEDSAHVFLVGAGAEAFALETGLQMVTPDYFVTPYRKRHLDEVRTRLVEVGGFGTQASPTALTMEEPAFGTVGAVACDEAGNVAAATSTGGMTSKRPGRVGDTPVIGSGTYADNETCAVSATGHGEWFIRTVFAHDIAARMKYAGLSLEQAVTATMEAQLNAHSAAGGLVAVNGEGHIAMKFNTEGMYRASLRAGQKPQVAIY